MDTIEDIAVLGAWGARAKSRAAGARPDGGGAIQVARDPVATFALRKYGRAAECLIKNREALLGAVRHPRTTATPIFSTARSRPCGGR
jgi:hypothetical protein